MNKEKVRQKMAELIEKLHAKYLADYTVAISCKDSKSVTECRSEIYKANRAKDALVKALQKSMGDQTQPFPLYSIKSIETWFFEELLKRHPFIEKKILREAANLRANDISKL